MATLPTVPVFSFAETPTVVKLNQLSAAVSFVTQMPIVVSCKKNATQSIPITLNTAVLWDVEETDTDNMHSTSTNPSRFTCVTQGYYKFHATVTATTTSTAAFTYMWFQQTTGSSNPLGAGHTQMFGVIGSQSGTTTADFKSYTMNSMTPCLYPGDYIEVYMYSTVAITVPTRSWWGSSNLDQAGFADGSPSLYAYYLFEGP
jgi:hypothetical protein